MKQYEIVTFSNLDSAISKVNEGLHAFERLQMIRADVTIQCKKIEAQMQIVDKQFQLLMHEMDVQLQTYKERADVTKLALNTLNSAMCKTLDSVLLMDDEGNESKLQLKFKMLEILNRDIESITQITLKFL